MTEKKKNTHPLFSIHNHHCLTACIGARTSLPLLLLLTHPLTYHYNTLSQSPLCSVHWRVSVVLTADAAWRSTRSDGDAGTASCPLVNPLGEVEGHPHPPPQRHLHRHRPQVLLLPHRITESPPVVHTTTAITTTTITVTKMRRMRWGWGKKARWISRQG